MQETLDEQIRQLTIGRSRLLVKLLSITKKDLDNRLNERLQELGYTDFKIGDMALLANMKLEGIINNELAKKAKITKQAMSKVAKNLEAGGYIYTQKHETDNRATVIFLTGKGKELLIAASKCVREIENYYAQIIGKTDAERLREILTKLVKEIHPACFNTDTTDQDSQ
ncbi:MarR family transcriptional regulator [Chitinophaga caeni]|uniref:MarR family transcriptional regulator n=1 Tax=Chitinophaga caeni TaxID=2029983 RepID=A0A291QPK3_9BACT|nr:MarR family transcriptional regulator [Chitinophaga caeni]ATL45823.1 MarR family transcriptional regulator [Chitinophaga caeni]